MEKTPLPHYHGEDASHAEIVRQMLENTVTFQRLSDIFRQLSDPNRIRIFWLSPTTSASSATAACF